MNKKYLNHIKAISTGTLSMKIVDLIDSCEVLALKFFAVPTKTELVETVEKIISENSIPTLLSESIVRQVECTIPHSMECSIEW
jgi:hypothetical protein